MTAQVKKPGLIIRDELSSLRGEMFRRDRMIRFTDGYGIHFDHGELPLNGATIEDDCLDDYESGEWTPQIQDENGNVAAHSVQLGHYTKIGDLVVVQGRVVTSSITGLTGSYVDLGGLPFLSTSDDFGVLMTGTVQGLAITAGESINGRTTPSTTTIELNLSDSANGTTSMLVTEWTADGGMTFNAHYKAI